VVNAHCTLTYAQNVSVANIVIVEAPAMTNGSKLNFLGYKKRLVVMLHFKKTNTPASKILITASSAIKYVLLLSSTVSNVIYRHYNYIIVLTVFQKLSFNLHSKCSMFHRITEWFVLEVTLQTISFQPP